MPTTIQIPKLTVRQIEIDIEGTTPLITHRMAQEVIEGIAGDQGVKKPKPKERPPRDPDAEFRASTYPLPDGGFGFPAIGIKKATITAAGRFTDAVMTQMMGGFFIPADLLAIISDNPPQMRTDRVRIGMGTTSLAYRAAFFPWSITVPITYIEEIISMDHIVNAVTLAGLSVGIGDWRVEKKGSFGQWMIAGVRELV
jgi:hypothetical protein